MAPTGVTLRPAKWARSAGGSRISEQKVASRWRPDRRQAAASIVGGGDAGAGLISARGATPTAGWGGAIWVGEGRDFLRARAPRDGRANLTEPEPELTQRQTRQREREARRRERPQGMVPGRERRRTKVERATMRLVATGGIIGIAVLLGAVLVGQDVAGWIVGLVIGLTSVILAALLWSSRQL
jgi:hypothetical protein